MKKLVWEVYCQSMSRNKIEPFNIFEHGRFREDVAAAYKKYKKNGELEEFKERVNRELFYYYGSKCEWEVLIERKDNSVVLSPWIGKENIQVELRDELNFDWLAFYNEMEQKFIKKQNKIKIDVCMQVRFKFDDFINYILKNA